MCRFQDIQQRSRAVPKRGVMAADREPLKSSGMSIAASPNNESREEARYELGSNERQLEAIQR
jgi:hypothetical protein